MLRTSIGRKALLRRIIPSFTTKSWLAFGIALFWILLIAASLFWNLHKQEIATTALLTAQARTHLREDQLYIRWLTLQGGVYFPAIGPSGVPSSHGVGQMDRDVTTTTGILLTLADPMELVHQVHEMDREEGRELSHMTSLRPLSSKNSADPWEAEALRAFEEGVKEISSVEVRNDRRYLRLMRPLITEGTCLKCHAAQGYKKGDIRGGVSVTVPFDPYVTAELGSRNSILIGHLAIGILGLVGLWAGTGVLRGSEKALRVSEEKFRSIAEQMSDIIFVADRRGVLLYVSPIARNLFGCSPDEMIGHTLGEFLDPSEGESSRRALSASLGQGEPASGLMLRMRRKDGSMFIGEFDAMSSHFGGEPGVTGLIRDISGRVRLQQQVEGISRMRESLLGLSVLQTKLTCITETVVAMFDSDFARIWIARPGDICESGCIHAHATQDSERCRLRKPCLHLVSSSGRYTHIDGAEHRRVPFGISKIGRVATGEEPRFVSNDATHDSRVHNREWAKELGLVACAAYQLISEQDKPIGVFALFSKQPISPEEGNLLQEVAVTASQVIQTSLAEEAKAHLEAQLRQSQKMELVGRLAGGVAHDFNNMLGIILGYAELVLAQLDPGRPLHADVTEILQAARRSVDLTRQLLGFARQQAVKPKILDLNETVPSMLNMLHRLIGEEIKLTWNAGPDPCMVMVDPAQIDQILANLCVNARDAIAGVGRITIETQKVAFDDVYCERHAGSAPGVYVMLAVSDNGCGISKEVLTHIFEPFFTTKGIGLGTGLGLATVFGIVKQNDGYINVDSEPGKGTTFKVYLPRVMGPKAESAEEVSSDVVQGCGEVVLLVEDEPKILNLARIILRRLGYVVLAAGTPSKAIQIASEHSDIIHLLLTDVVMPEMNGRELAERIREIQPTIRCLYMSGYTANAISDRGVLEENVEFIQKPFSMRDLAAKVRETLGQG